MNTIIPPYLKKGNTIGITCSSGFMEKVKANACIKTLQEWGLEVMVGKTLNSTSTNYFSAPDEEKIAELQAMLDDENIHAILFGRGGYGMGRIIDKLSFKKFKKNPKWLIGFSDITVMHCHLIGACKIASIHGPMAAAFNKSSGSAKNVEALKNVIFGKKIHYDCAYHPFNTIGSAEGKLIGGNLALLCNVIGTKSDFDCKNKILFIEDVGEYKYAIDRMLHQLKRAGKFDQLAGLIIGGFTDIKDTERPFGMETNAIIKEVLKEYNFPICFDFPISHGKENLAVKIGMNYNFKVTKAKTALKEI